LAAATWSRSPAMRLYGCSATSQEPDPFTGIGLFFFESLVSWIIHLISFAPNTYLFAGLTFIIPYGSLECEHMFGRGHERVIDPSRSANDKRVYVGALIAVRHYTLLVEEAEQANVSRSDVLRWALTERYGDQQATEGRAQEA